MGAATPNGPLEKYHIYTPHLRVDSTSSERLKTGYLNLSHYITDLPDSSTFLMLKLADV